jgi:uncharacterized protein (TIGR03790 family)
MAGRNKLFISILAVFFLGAGHSANGDTGASVALVYNSSMPASKAVADHYATQRKVPAEQIFAFDLPQGETMSRDEFANKLQQPLWNELRARKLLTYGDAENTAAALKSRVTDAKIRYVVLCYGVPLKITPDTSLKENADNLPTELRRNEAAVESELSILPLLDQKPLLAGPLSNPVGLATNRFAISPTNGVLIVARLDGPTPEIAKGLVDKAIQAEKDGLWGNAYFDTRSITNAGFKQADDMFNAGAELAKLYGFEVIKETSSRTFAPSTPLSDIALYFGWYDQSVSGPFTNGMAQFRPGAVAYHLHSFSARHLRTPDVWWAGPLLAAGATATMGFTEEPYLQTTPQVNAFVFRFLQLGFSFGEAAYASMPSLSWQTAVIGDPLYRPYQKNQKEWYEEMERRKSKDVEWSMMMWINFRLAQKAELDEILQFYKTNPATEESAVLQEKLGDLYKSKGKLIDAMTPYSRALKLTMTPLHKLRLSLKAAAIFSTMGRAEQAYSIYQEVLREYPAYPDKKDIYERLARVATTLKKKDEAAEFQRLAREQASL